MFPSSILVVDDDSAVCTFMQRVLEGGGYHVWTAHSGGEAMNVLEDHGRELHLLVTDVVMPDMSGPILARAAAKWFPDLPVLYVSGYCANYGDELPVVTCLQKPFTPVALLERVRALIAPAVDMASAH